jgi:hypothetical protein
MEITKEMIQEQVETMAKNMEGYKQGFVTAMSWVLTQIETKKEPVESK